MNKAILLGAIVTELTSGFRGTVIIKYIERSGNVRYAVQPKGDGEKIPDAMVFDQNSLEYVDAGISDRCVEPDSRAFELELGCEVKDRISGFKGICTSRSVHLNGCVLYTITAQKVTTKEEEGIKSFHWYDVERIGYGLLPKPTPAPTAAPVMAPASAALATPGNPVKPTGGPATKLKRDNIAKRV
jgi:hypothetical protein